MGSMVRAKQLERSRGTLIELVLGTLDKANIFE
jgi:hypothetical protein